MKNNIIERLRADGLPGIKPVTSPEPAPVPAPYVDGPDKCHMHIWEYWHCGDDATNLGVKVQIWDAAGQQMVFTDEIQAGDSSPASIFSPLPKVLVVTAEHRNDYLQFGYGATFWTSKDNDQSKDQWCTTGGWDPREGPDCPSGGGSPFDTGSTQETPSVSSVPDNAPQMEANMPCRSSRWTATLYVHGIMEAVKILSFVMWVRSFGVV
jgi:hypothetical protein